MKFTISSISNHAENRTDAAHNTYSQEFLTDVPKICVSGGPSEHNGNGGNAFASNAFQIQGTVYS